MERRDDGLLVGPLAALPGGLDANASLDTGTKIAEARLRANPVEAQVSSEARPPRADTDPVTP